MADEVCEEKEDALQLIANTAEQSVNMKKKGLKQTIIETVSTLRNLIAKLHDCRDGKIAEISKLEEQVNDLRPRSHVPVVDWPAGPDYSRTK